MPTVVCAGGALLQHIVATSPPTAHHGLHHDAFVRFDAAQAKTGWALEHQRRFALVDGPHLLAAAARYDLIGALDQQPVTICALGAVFGSPDHADADAHAEALVEHVLKDATRDGVQIWPFFSASRMRCCLGWQIWRRFRSSIPRSQSRNHLDMAHR